MEEIIPSLSEWITLSVSATNSLKDFMKTSICPVFKDNSKEPHFHAAIMTTYNRIGLWLDDLSIVNSPIHIQLAATCVRSIFEHLLDLKWLILNPEEAKKFSAFTHVRKFDIAEKISSECNLYPEIDRNLFKAQLNLANDLQSQKIRNELCKQNNWITKAGITRKPKHWWGENTEQRAHAIDAGGITHFQTYLNLYSLLSNFIHPGGVSLIGISGKGLANLFISLHRHGQDFCLQATELICNNFPVPENIIEEFQKKFFGEALYK